MDVTVYEAELSGRLATAARHLSIVTRFVSGGRVLDVGCASGLFLKAARDAGWNVAGVEPSEALFAKARAALGESTELYCTTLEHTKFATASFDVVTMWDVLEHVPDPLGFLQTCASLLKPGAHLFVNVPDLDSFEARILRKRWPLFLAEHLNYFNRKSLRLCGEKAGLKWKEFGRRRVSFSVDYILFRLAQHRIPGAAPLREMSGKAARIQVPISLGETYGVWTRWA
jgi:SAM-dependent methyltransferase